jgi:hypothetical protein
MNGQFVENGNMNKEQARKLHEEAYVIDGLNASYFFNEAVLRRIRQGDCS